jgi:uncharacterized coiled-coil protein SlyX
MRAPRRRTTADKVISAGLATAACAGLIGVIGVRTIEQAAAATNTSDSQAVATPDVAAPVAEATSSAGLTQAQLDTYSAQLTAERTKLDAYRAKLVKVAKKLKSAQQQSAAAAVVSVPTASRPSTVSKPVAKAAPAPAAKPKPASNTKSS